MLFPKLANLSLLGLLFLGANSVSASELVLPKQEASKTYLESLVKYEQVVNDKVENLKIFASIKDSRIDPQYEPKNQQSFLMKSYLVPTSDVVILGDIERASKVLVKNSNEEIFVRFFVHPASEDFYKKHVESYTQETSYRATPLSSYRSILVWNENETKQDLFNLKVTLDAKIGGFKRYLSLHQMERATIISHVMNTMDKEVLRKEKIAIIDEPVSIYLKTVEAGYSWREVPALERGAELVPMFSLYALKSSQGEQVEKSMLQEMIDESGLSAKAFVKEKIMRPLLRHMLIFAKEEGIIGDPHEQNVLVEVKNRKLTGRFFYRDLAGFYLSPELRKIAGKNTDFIPKSFSKDSLLAERTNFFDKFQNYLLDANFYALRESIEKGSLSTQWIEQTSFEILRTEIKDLYGRDIEQWSGVNRAIKLGPVIFQCNKIFKRGA